MRFQLNETYSRRFIILISILMTLTVIFFQIFSVQLIRSDHFPHYIFDRFTVNGKISDMEYRTIPRNGKKEYLYTAKFTSNDISHLLNQDNRLRLMIYRLTGSAYRISVNSYIIGSAGSFFGNYNSNIWNSLKVFEIPAEIIRSRNTLSIEIKADYEAGKSRFPIILTNAEEGQFILSWFSFWFESINRTVLGILIFTFLIMMIFFLKIRYFKLEYLFFALASIFFALNLFDYLSISYLPVPVDLFKKGVTISIYLSAFFISGALYIEFRNKIMLIPALSGLFLITLSALFTNNLSDFKTATQIINLILLLSILSWLIQCLSHFKKSVTARILLPSSVFFFLFSMHDILYILDGSMPSYSLAGFGGMIFALTLIFLLVYHFLRVYRLMIRAKERNKLINKIFQQNKNLILKTTELEIEIQEKQKAKNALERSEKRYRNMAELLPAGICELDEDLNIHYTNRQTRNILQLDHSSEKNMNLLNFICDEDRSRFEEHINRLRTSSSPEICEYKFRNVSENSDPFLCLISASYIPENIPERRIIISITEIKSFLLSAVLPDNQFFEHYQLTKREKEIVDLLVMGYKNKDIASKYFISEPTVKTHIMNIYHKTGVNKRRDFLNLYRDYQKKRFGNDTMIFSILSGLYQN